MRELAASTDLTIGAWPPATPARQNDFAFQAWLKGIDRKKLSSLRTMAKRTGVSLPVYIRENLGINIVPPTVVGHDSRQTLSDAHLAARAYSSLMRNPGVVRYDTAIVVSGWDD